MYSCLSGGNTSSSEKNDDESIKKGTTQSTTYEYISAAKLRIFLNSFLKIFFGQKVETQ